MTTTSLSMTRLGPASTRPGDQDRFGLFTDDGRCVGHITKRRNSTTTRHPWQAFVAPSGFNNDGTMVEIEVQTLLGSFYGHDGRAQAVNAIFQNVNS